MKKKGINQFHSNRIDAVMAFQILADAAKTNIDILETIQLLAQGSLFCTEMIERGFL